MQIMTRENNDSTNALRPRRFKYSDVSTKFISYMHDTSFSVNFSPSISFITYVSNYRKM